ncbi:MAG: tRNA (N(6)-L-threonylcarbamoyladenosine(37)-C(2))-methylthiotransferase MtaB [Clostridia bacterium]|nr:tRNA (N(6)-L-threonylcarbamoyladenosine(37)-C(2))-methylthiotransferase MtaB [Clostridia bacterium]
MKVAFYTLGCKVNQYETNGMIQKFEEAGFEVVPFNKKSDVYIINTCTVTSISDRKSRQMLRRAKELNPDGIVVACGCYVQVAKDVVDGIEEIDLSIGTNEKKDIVKIVEDFINDKKKPSTIDDVFHNEDYQEFGNIIFTEKVRAVIKVQDGCDRFCSYCIIPYARGRVRSRDKDNVISEIKQIVKENGIKEVIITGIHVASYGKDFKNGYGLIDLLEEINEIDGLERIRLGSIEPLIISEEFMERLSKLKKYCHHFHLSLQSACNTVLERMNRRYTIEEFMEITDRIRRYYDDAILTTDVIVGFPGETDEEFETTVENLNKIKFYKMHIFKYSQRNGTKAAVMENQVSPEIKEKRSKILIDMSDKFEKEYQKLYIGKTVDVLFEEMEDGFLKGHTANYMMVKSKGKEDYINSIKKVKISGTENAIMEGEII